MVLLVHPLQASARDVRVDLRRGDVGVAEHHLHGAQIGAMFEQMRGKRMPQHVRRDVRGDAGVAGMLDDFHPERLPRHWAPKSGKKEVWICAFAEFRTSALE